MKLSAQSAFWIIRLMTWDWRESVRLTGQG